MLRLLTPLLLIATPSLGLANDLTATVDFESGTLGWSGPGGTGGATTVVPNGGNGGGAGFQTIFNDFFVTFRTSTNPAFVGDFSQFGSVEIAVDIKVNRIDFFGSPVPRPWLVELRDYDSAQGGYPWTSVWYLFDNISQSANSNWTTYSVTIADPTSTTLPAGWGGYGAEDPVTFEPLLPAGVTFADVLAGVDEAVFTTGQPGFFFGFTDFDLVLDNLTVATTGGPWCDLGQGLPGTNGEPDLVGFGPLTAGAPTSLGLTNAAGSAPAFLAVGFGRIDLPLLGGVLVPSADIAVIQAQTSPQGALPFNFSWPNGLAPGTDVFWQYWIVDLAGPFGVVPSNALQSTTP